MVNNHIITENDYPIEPIWILKNTVLSLLGLPLVFIWMLVVIFANSYKVTRQIIFLTLFLVSFLLFFAAPIPIHFVINFLKRKNFHYSLDEKFLNLHQGILSRQNRQLPYGVIQNVMVERRVLDRIFGLATLTIENASSAGGAYTFQYNKKQQMSRGNTPGFQLNYVKIPGLSVQNAEIVKNLILEKIKANPIVEIGL